MPDEPSSLGLTPSGGTAAAAGSTARIEREAATARREVESLFAVLLRGIKNLIQPAQTFSKATASIGSTPGGRAFANGGDSTIRGQDVRLSMHPGGYGSGGTPTGPGGTTDGNDHGGFYNWFHAVGHRIGALGGVDFLAAQQAAGIISSTGSRPYNYYQSGAQQFGYNRSYLAIQSATQAGRNYGQGNSFYNFGQKQVTGIEQGVRGGWLDLNDLYSGVSTLQSRAGNQYSGRLANQVGQLSQFAPQLGGYAGTADFYNKLMTPSMVNQLQPFGGGLVGAGGKLRTPTGTLTQLARIGAGQTNAQWGSGALSLTSVRAGFGAGGKGRFNLQQLGFSDAEIDVIEQYSERSAASGSSASLGIPTKSFAKFQSDLTRAQARTKATGFQSAEESMQQMDAVLTKLNSTLQTLQRNFGGLGYSVGVLGKSAGQAAIMLTELAAVRDLSAILTGGKAAGLGGLSRSATSTIGLGGTAGLGLAGALGLGVGALLGGAGGAALARHVTHGNRFAGVGGGIAGGAAVGAGLGLLGGPFAPLTSTAGAIGGGIIGGVGGLLGIGDPLPAGPETAGLNPSFRSSLDAMFAANPRLHLNSGWRSSTRQAELYKQYGPGRAAPPGKSLHEKGLAADIGPPSEYGWLAANAAKYGVTIPMPGKEPWHVQPVNARQTSGSAVVMEEAGGGGAVQTGGQTLGGANYAGQSSGQIISSMQAASQQGGRAMTGLGAMSSSSATTASVGTVGGAAVGGGGGKLSIAQIAADAKAAGFTGPALRTAVAVALAESGGDPRARSKPNSDAWHSIDQGLFQINNHWHNVANVFDPMANARAAYQISGGGSNFSAWSTYKSGAYQKYMSAVNAAGVGDPVAGSTGSVVVPMGGGTTVHVNGLNFTVKVDKVGPEEADRLCQLFLRSLQKEAADKRVGSL